MPFFLIINKIRHYFAKLWMQAIRIGEGSHKVGTRPTLKDVAQKSGYALRTVKKVMSGDPSVRDSTKQAVLAAAESLNYTKNLAATALAKNQIQRVAVVYTAMTKAYFPEVAEGFRTAQAGYRDFGLHLEFHILEQPGDAPQKALLESFLQREDLNGVILQPISATSLNPQIDALAEAGIPVITFGADAPDSRRLCYAGPNAYKSGRIGGQILANYVGKKGKVYIVNRGGDHMQTRERSAGFMDRMREYYPEICVQELNLNDDKDLYYHAVQSVVTREPVVGLFCTDANTLIAGQVLHDLGRPDVALVGFDLSDDGISLMKDGYIRVIIEQKPESFSALATTLMFRYLAAREKPEEQNYTPLYILTSECLD